MTQAARVGESNERGAGFNPKRGSTFVLILAADMRASRSAADPLLTIEELVGAAPQSDWWLDRTAETAQQIADRGSKNDQSSDGQNGHQGNNQSVFDETLRLFSNVHVHAP